MKAKNRIIAAIVAFALAVTAIPAYAAQYIDGVGSLQSARRSELSLGVSYVESALTNTAGNKVEEKYVEYMPGSGTVPVVAYGTTLYGMSTAAYVANFLAGRGKEVIAGVNGDFFFTDSGIPTGIVITDGILRSSDSGMTAVGFRADGTSIIGTPKLDKALHLSDGSRINIDYVNKTIRNYGTYLLTEDFSATSRSSAECKYILLTNVTGNLTVGGYIEATVSKISVDSAPINIAAGTMLLCATTENANSAKFDALYEGMTIGISMTAQNYEWNEVAFATGGGTMLLENGVTAANLDKTKAPRTAAGITADGRLIMYTVDGRQSAWSAGMSLVEVAERMKSLGCVTAVNLDGGGSTAILATNPGYTTPETKNKPSDGKLRTGANYIFFLNETPKTGNVERLFFYPEEINILAGSSYEFNVKATDINYHATSVPQGLTKTAEIGAFDASGKYIAGKFAGTDNIIMSYGNARAFAYANIYAEPTEIQILRGGTQIKSLNLLPGETVELDAGCFAGATALISNDEALSWWFEGNGGIVDKSGKFTASNTSGAYGVLRVAYGNTMTEINVTVGRAELALETFEGSSYSIGTGGDGMALALNKNTEFVRLGVASGKIDYNFADGKEAFSLGTNWTVPNGYGYLRLWVYGDNSGNELYLTVGAMQVLVCKLDFSGYRQVTIELPKGTASVSALTLVNAENAVGTIYLDHITLSESAVQSQAMPEIRDFIADDMAPDSTVSLTAFVHDSGFAVSEVGLFVNGIRTVSNYDKNSCKFIANVALDVAVADYRFTLEAVDFDGNRVRLSIDYKAFTTESVFADAAGHWSAQYADYLYQMGVIEPQNGLYYFPEQQMTRQAFAVMMAKYLRVNPSDYAEAAQNMPFTDVGEIAPEALNYIAAMYKNGIINGKNNSGVLLFDPYAGITRAEIMTILSRSLPKGYASVNQSFTDAAAIPEYAKEHVGVMIALGAVNGYTDGSVKPGNNVKNSEAIKMLSLMY